MRYAVFVICLMASLYMWAVKPVSDDALKQLCRDANSAIMTFTDVKDKQVAFDTQTSAWSKQYNVNTISADQVTMIFEFGGLNLDRFLRVWLEPVLTAKSEKDAAFAYLKWMYMPENDGFIHTPKETAALIAFLQSKDLQKQLNQHPAYATGILNALSTMKDANWETEGFSNAVLTLLKCRLSEVAVIDCVKAFKSVARADRVTKQERDAIRLACINQYKELLKTTDLPRKQKVCQENIAFLEGPFACGTLVGNSAPTLHFLRVFKQVGDSVEIQDVKTLDDFKGKVVLIDFWGTKCVPCIQSFPEIAKIQQHFEQKDVVILGVTSLQGYFADIPNHRTVQCRNNPEKEMGCFPDYMKSMGINWHIAISQQDVMNTDYGVLAIPHVTIIDQEGRVRYNAVNADETQKIKLVEDLLSE